MEHRWKHGAAFAEYAEALHIDTNQIVAVMSKPVDGSQVWVVMWTDLGDYEPPEEQPVYASALTRDEDSILVTDRARRPVCTIGDLLPMLGDA